MQESLQCIRMGMNERFLALRDLKRRLIENIKKDNIRIHEINKELNIGEEELFEPEIDDSEWPERREQFNDEDLIEFERELRRREKEAAKAQKGGNAFGGPADEDDEEGGGDGGDGDGDGRVEDADNAEHDGTAGHGGNEAGDGSDVSSESSASSASDSESNAGSDADSMQLDDADALDEAELEKRKSLREALLMSIPKSSMQERQEEARQTLLQHEKSTLLNKINTTIEKFDEAVKEMRKEKFLLDNDLTSADLKMLRLLEELKLLRSFEERESKLNENLAKSRADKAQGWILYTLEWHETSIMRRVCVCVYV